MTPDRITSDPPPEERRGVEADSQTQTLELFTLLSALRPNWAGSLILACGLTPAGSSLALAANIAGAACLSIDPSADLCRSALRSGSVDFTVNTLDEALRALKNEIRQGRPLSVALEADPATLLPEILDRGLLPQLFTAFSDLSSSAAVLQAAETLHDLGTLLVDFDGQLKTLPGALDARKHLEQTLLNQALSRYTFSFEAPKLLRSFDARVLDLLPPADPRRRWALAASRHFIRVGSSQPPYSRVLVLTGSEHDRLSSL